MPKMYLRDENRNHMELETGKASYKTLVDNFVGDIVLCNKIMEEDIDLFDNILIGYIDEDTEIYQAYICNVNKMDLEQLQELRTNDIIIAYSPLLDVDVLLVDHLGTSWSEVPTDVKLTNEF